MNGKAASSFWTSGRPGGELGHRDGGRQTVPRARRKPPVRTEPHPLAWPDAALATGRRAEYFRRRPFAAGDSADFDFPLAFAGTFFMHSHQGLQGAAFDVRARSIIRDPNARQRRRKSL